jgi:hypothetical protein
MVRLELTAEEAAELREILMRYLSELRMEIVDTDRSDYKDYLRGEKSTVNQILERLTQELAPPA